MRNKKGQFIKGNKRPKEWTQAQTEKVSGKQNYAWKGEGVSYRGLHQWVRRNKGKPIKCVLCGFSSTKPKRVQWANVDGKYRRSLDDFISLCASCHKIYDIRLQSIRDGKFASQ